VLDHLNDESVPGQVRPDLPGQRIFRHGEPVGEWITGQHF
jgi:hypothetical protein